MWDWYKEVEDVCSILQNEVISFLEKFSKTNLNNKGEVHCNIGTACKLFIMLKRKYNLERYATFQDFDIVTKGKNHLWKAIRYCPKDAEINRLKYMTNLGQVLSICYRVVEALDICEMVLKRDECFIEALEQKAFDLSALNNISKSGTLKVLYTIVSIP